MNQRQDGARGHRTTFKFFIITDDNTLITAAVQVCAPFVTFYVAGGPLNLLLIPYGQPQSTIFSSPVIRDFLCGRGINNKMNYFVSRCSSMMKSMHSMGVCTATLKPRIIFTMSPSAEGALLSATV